MANIKILGVLALLAPSNYILASCEYLKWLVDGLTQTMSVWFPPSQRFSPKDSVTFNHLVTEMAVKILSVDFEGYDNKKQYLVLYLEPFTTS